VREVGHEEATKNPAILYKLDIPGKLKDEASYVFWNERLHKNELPSKTRFAKDKASPLSKSVPEVDHILDAKKMVSKSVVSHKSGNLISKKVNKNPVISLSQGKKEILVSKNEQRTKINVKAVPIPPCQGPLCELLPG
jgi:hypothetical protein